MNELLKHMCMNNREREREFKTHKKQRVRVSDKEPIDAQKCSIKDTQQRSHGNYFCHRKKTLTQSVYVH